ncbi:hypothetical protein [Listeria ivanovii]|nr:hypothetical protein [Listeria ivanovii]MBK3913718.1 hypothetical protein [Listeria ivanovii subsp. ivanovii]MBK3926008.1 hypothetical protein [Listeria ivanovii subsp. ivanovii]
MVLFASVSYVQAGSTYANYSTTVGKFNGNGYTAYQTKKVAGQKANVKSTKTGGYKLNVRTNSAGSNGTWSADFTNSKNIDLSNGHNKGTKTRLHFSNKITTTRDVQASGSWRSN